VAIASASGSCRQTDPTTDIFAVEQRIFRAIEAKDAAALEPILADDFVFRDSRGGDLTRAEFLKNVASIPAKIESVRGEHLKVDVYGDTAILTGLQRAAVTADGKQAASHGAFADVFMKRGGRWQLVLAHSVDVP
jgi:ketosteroid isomerase-like protein